MKFTITINQEKAIEWGLNLPQSSLIDLFLLLPQWADTEIIDGDVWYFFSKNKILDEMPILSKTGKVDTIYRQAKALQEAGLLDYKKQGNRDLWKLKPKIKEWSFNNSEKNPSNLGKKSGKASEKNPTYNNTISDNNTNDNISLSTENKFSDDSFEVKASSYFYKTHEGIKTPSVLYLIKKEGFENLVYKQAAAVEKLKRIDGLSEQEIRAIILFALQDSFWQKNILSLEKLRKKNRDNVPYYVVLVDRIKSTIEKQNDNLVHKF